MGERQQRRTSAPNELPSRESIADAVIIDEDRGGLLEAETTPASERLRRFPYPSEIGGAEPPAGSLSGRT